MKVLVPAFKSFLTPLVLFTALIVGSAAATAWAAESAGSSAAAIAAAEAASSCAAALKNQWTPTAVAIADAKKSAAAGNHDLAVAFAHSAEALAKGSITQAEQEAEAWKSAVIR